MNERAAHPRTQAREQALRILYQVDLRDDVRPEDLFHEVDAEIENDDARRFARDLVLGVRREREAIDAELSAIAHNWSLGRMAAIDRNVLRLGAYELMFRPDLPPAVSINEAVELAKKYSTKDSGAFVNGILDKVRIRAEQRAPQES